MSADWKCSNCGKSYEELEKAGKLVSTQGYARCVDCNVDLDCTTEDPRAVTPEEEREFIQALAQATPEDTE